MTGSQLNQLRANSSGTFRVLYYDGTSEIITLNNGSYTWSGDTYTIIDGNPLTIEWPNGVIQTLQVTQDNFIRWTTNSTDNKYSFIVWEPINGGLENSDNVEGTTPITISNPTSNLLPNM